MSEQEMSAVAAEAEQTQEGGGQEQNQADQIPVEGSLLREFYVKYYEMSEQAQAARRNRNAAQHLDKVSKSLWKGYYEKEKKVYKHILADVNTPLEGTIDELCAQFGVDGVIMSGIIDGMNESLKEPVNAMELFGDTRVSLLVEPEVLYRNMILAKADWLYGMPEWETILPEERRREIADEVRREKAEKTVVKEIKVGRNDPCPCGSGKKYKYCCGRNA